MKGIQGHSAHATPARPPRSFLGAPDADDDFSLLVFDSLLPKGDDAEPRILFSYSTMESSPFLDVNQAGIFITLIKFCMRFRCSAPCNYVETDGYCTGIAELDADIFFSLKRRKGASDDSATGANLKLIVDSCRQMFRLFFPPLHRDAASNALDAKSVRIVQEGFGLIAKSIFKIDMTIERFYESAFKLDLSYQLDSSISSICYQLISNHNSPIMNIAVLYSHYYIYSSFPPDVSRTISLALRVKFSYLFPKVLVKEENKLYWIIGMWYSERGELNVYSPPLYIGEHVFPFVALRCGKFRFIITLKENVSPTNDVLLSLPYFIKPLKSFLSNLDVKTIVGKFDASYFRIQCDKRNLGLNFANHKVPEVDIPLVQSLLLTCKSYGTDFAKYSNICFPAPSDFFISYKNNEKEEIVAMIKTYIDKVSDQIESCNLLNKIENIYHLEVKMKR